MKKKIRFNFFFIYLFLTDFLSRASIIRSEGMLLLVIVGAGDGAGTTPNFEIYIATNFSPRSLTPPTLIKKKIHLTPFIRNPPLIIQINKNKKNGK